MHNNIIYNEHKGVAFTYIPKAACTNWKCVMRRANGAVDWLDSSIAHDKRISGLNFLSAARDLRKVSCASIRKYAMVRHPYTRILSAYLNKIQPLVSTNPSEFCRSHWAEVYRDIDAYRKSHFGPSQYPHVTFTLFLKWIRDSGSRFAHDEHWTPQHQLLGLPHIVYNYIGTFENIERDATYILSELGVDCQFPTQERLNFSASNASKHLLEYLSPEAKDLIDEIYDEDFKYFGYSKDPYQVTQPNKSINLVTDVIEHRIQNKKSSVGEIFAAAARWRLWAALAWEDMKATYKRSSIGVLWVSLSFVIFITVKIIIFGSMVGPGFEQYYSLYVTVGFFAWQYMSQILSAGSQIFTSNENWIKNDPIELPVFGFQAVLRSLFDFALTAVVVAGAFIVLGADLSLMMIFALPAVLVYICNSLWIVLLLGIICTRYRDFTHLVNAAIKVMFFLTPIVWLPEQLPESVVNILWWNPFFHFMAILRDPLLFGSASLTSWSYVGAFTVIGWAITLLVYSRYRKRVIFWL